MSRNVNIGFTKPSSFDNWDNFVNSYVFLTNGNDFLSGVLSYTYTVKVENNVGGKTNEYYSVGPFGPYYDYAFSTNGYTYNSQVEGHSTLTLSKYNSTKNIVINKGHVDNRYKLFGIDKNKQIDSNIFNNKSSVNAIITQGKSIIQNRDNFVNLEDFLNNGNSKYKTDLENNGTNKGTVTVSYTYYVNVQNLDKDDNLYVVVAKPSTDEDNLFTANQKLGLFVPYTYSNTRKDPKFAAYEQAGQLELKSYIETETWDSTYHLGSLRIQNISGSGNLVNWINKNFLEYITNSELKEDGTSYLYGMTTVGPNKISQHSGLYQIPTNELVNSENQDIYIDLLYNGSYVSEVSPKVQDKYSENTDYYKSITYSYLVNKKTGEITTGDFSKHSYIYGYTFVPTIFYSVDGNISEIETVSYTGSLRTINEMFPASDSAESIRRYEQYVSDKSFKKSFTSRNGITYTTSYTICVCNINSGQIVSKSDTDNYANCYAYTSYIFSYDINELDYTACVLPFEYLLNNPESGYDAELPEEYDTGSDVDPEPVPPYVPTFVVDYSKSKNKWNLTYDESMSSYYFFDANLEEPAEYVKFQFSDNDMQKTQNLKLNNRNNKITITSHSNVFYLNIVQTKGNYGGFIPKVTTSNDLTFYQGKFTGENYGWRFAFIRKDDTVKSSEIYIGVPKFNEEQLSIEDSFDNKITSLYDVCLKVNYDITSPTDKANGDITTVSEIQQSKDILYKSTVNVPEITAETEYFWTDDVFNRTGHEYTNVCAIQTNSGLEYFGIRSKKHGNDERNNFKFNNSKPVLSKTETGTYYLGYDLNGLVVPLTTTKENDYIYTFKNGEQYLKVKDTWKGKELFQNYISAYEFSVGGELLKPKYCMSYTATRDGLADEKFIDISKLYDKTTGETTWSLLPTYSTYSVSIPFTKEILLNNNLVIKNSSLFEKTNDSTYEGTFVEIPNDDKDIVLNNDYVNLYYQEISYTQIKSPDIDYIKTLEENQNSLYKFNYYYRIFQPYEINELKNLDETSIIYERCVVYKQINNVYKEVEDSSVEVNKKSYYIQDYNYTEAIKGNQPVYTLYYANNSYYVDAHKEYPNDEAYNFNKFKYTYIPQSVGIVTDDSIQYYAYTYALIKDDELSQYKQSDENVYIKDNYRKVNTIEDYNSLFERHVKFYTCEGDLKLYPIHSSQLTDDLDLDGNTIYVKEDTNKDNESVFVAFDTNELKEDVLEQNDIASYGVETNQEIQKRKELTRKGIFKGKTTFAAENVVSSVCLFNYDGKYTEYANIYKNPSLYEFRSDGKLYVKDDEQSEGIELYVNEIGYTSISSNFISVGSNQKYYAWRIDKINHNEVRTLDITDSTAYIYVDASKFELDYEFDGSAGILTNPITNKQITIAKVNKYGFIECPHIRYYSRELKLVKTKDVFMHPNKVYYKNSSFNKLITTGSTPIINLTYTEYDNVGKTLKFKPPYGSFSTGYTFQFENTKYYNNTKIVSYLSDTVCDYAYQLETEKGDEFIKTRYLYQNYTINDNIKKSVGGAYYTNIYVFDKNTGAVNKTLYLDQHIIDINTYNYTYTEYYDEKVTNGVLLNNLSPLNYKDYYVITKDGENIELTETSNSPAYYFSEKGYSVYRKVSQEKRYDYACQTNTGSYQYFNKKSNTPITFTVDDNLFGIVAGRYDISTTPTSYSYNMFDLEVVKLYRMSRNNVGPILQEQNAKDVNTDKTVPFSLTNDFEYVPTGSYTWHNPIFTYQTYGTSSYNWKLVEQTEGYWTKDYTKNIIPFNVASYTFYPDVNSISNTSLTYSFIGNSYVLSSVVEYPKISYDIIDVVTEEQIYYSYVLDGIEQHYEANKKVQDNGDGTYTGLVKQFVFDKDSNSFIEAVRPIPLTKHNIVTKNSKVTNVINQEHKLDTTYFAYKTSLALTNESIPVLYNTELIPATTKEIQYWDAEKQTYKLKTVIASYAYYAYQYLYDTIPFKVSSYLFKASYLTIDNFNELGTYVASSSYALSEDVKLINKNFNEWAEQYKAAEHEKLLSINKAYDLISAYVKDGFVEIGKDITTLSSDLTNAIQNSIDKASYQETQNTNVIVDVLSSYGYSIADNISTFDTHVAEAIIEHKDELVESVNTLTSYVKNTILSETIEIPESIDIVSRDGIIISYSYVFGNGLNNLCDVLLKSFLTSTSETYTYTDDYGYTHNVIKYTYTGIGDSLRRIQIVPAIPTKQEFVMDLAPKMFANTDFDTEIVDEVKYDEQGNITEKITHKNNPTEVAKKVIYRANILWNELAKGGYCEDSNVEEKQDLLNDIKNSTLKSTEAVKKLRNN